MGKGTATRPLTTASKTAKPLLLLCLLLLLFTEGCKREPKETYVPPPPTIEPPMVNPWKEAANKIEEDRGEPAGRKAEVDVPPELKHYSDRRRFLAVQVAEWREQKYPVPHDYAELIDLIKQNQMVEMAPLGPEYILYGVGGHASKDPFTHYDEASGEEIPLYSSKEGFDAEYARLTELTQEQEKQVAGFQQEIAKTRKKDASRRRELQSQVAGARKTIAELDKRKKLLASFYKSPERSKLVFAEYRQLAELAADFGGKAYDLNDPAGRQNMKVRLLSFMRPEARDVMLEIARSYKQKFDRPLPITSLVRTESYQQELSETNPNATRIAVPPHTTGLAFDIYYKYMTAAEQDYLMAEIAKLKQAGRLEALRETRDHFHVFAFADGQLPDESLIATALSQLGTAKAEKSNRAAQAKPKAASARAASKAKRKPAKSSGVASKTRKGGKTAARGGRRAGAN